jgi:hypothetical protein
MTKFLAPGIVLSITMYLFCVYRDWWIIPVGLFLAICVYPILLKEEREILITQMKSNILKTEAETRFFNANAGVAGNVYALQRGFPRNPPGGRS